jgi:hypothetical protein
MSTDAAKPTVPPEAAEAALIAYERGIGYSTRERVRWAVAAAMPHLLPGWYVAPDNYGDPTIWADNPFMPGYPDVVLARTSDTARLFDGIAALLPDHTDQEG